MAPQQSERKPSTTDSVKTGMTMTEKILARASEKTQFIPGENVWVNIGVLMTHDVCGPGSIGIFKKEFGENAKVWDREKIVIIPDHYIFTSDERANRNVDILRDFCMEQNIKYFYDIKDLGNFKANPDYKGVCHIALAQEVPMLLNPIHCIQVLLGTDSCTCKIGAFGQFATGIGNTDAGFVLGTGKLLLKGKKVNVPTFLVPATQKVWMDLYGLQVPGSGGKTCSQIFEEAGCDTPASPSCGACLGGPKDTYARMNEPMFLLCSLSNQVWRSSVVVLRFEGTLKRLHKALYGLRQSPRAWYSSLSNRLVDLGFNISIADPSLFLCTTSNNKLCVLVYVDDMLITGSLIQQIYDLVEGLRSDFPITDLGVLRYFLGVEVTSNSKGFLHNRSISLICFNGQICH
ncbi:3-isopropylmalate dehydratase large subunit, chloroplastic-like [Carya illinoinensis]|uniref:3-isopropylmalate dehydratase large subunit, chloroplastic-like n=1 Tax=Carya illinoinensis TaxID=32201 RepID=UPI001C72958A|nr:3-isopropylmalate dehydratase large subunit, chloroplastic-like [Carya illinoinensis]